MNKEVKQKNISVLKDICIYSGNFVFEEIGQFPDNFKVTIIKTPEIYSTKEKDEHIISKQPLKQENEYVPILIKAEKNTNFIYKVDGITSEQAEEINAVETRTKIKDRIKMIRNLGGIFTYFDMDHAGFKRNLIMVDSSMPQILGNILMYYYIEDVKDCKSLVELVGERDPLGYHDAAMYEYKFKKFLCSCALGMKPEKRWDGLDEANGGYIIVKSDEEILAYHIYNRNLFEQYLFDNTVLERASIGRHEFMSLYEENGEIFIKFNLQMRFK